MVLGFLTHLCSEEQSHSHFKIHFPDKWWNKGGSMWLHLLPDWLTDWKEVRNSINHESCNWLESCSPAPILPQLPLQSFDQSLERHSYMLPLSFFCQFTTDWGHVKHSSGFLRGAGGRAASLGSKARSNQKSNHSSFLLVCLPCHHCFAGKAVYSTSPLPLQLILDRFMGRLSTNLAGGGGKNDPKPAEYMDGSVSKPREASVLKCVSGDVSSFHTPPPPPRNTL